MESRGTRSGIVLAIVIGAQLAGAEEVCPLGNGYWKTHPEVWPRSALFLGNEAYASADLLDLLHAPPAGDASVILAHQLIAARLNVANGAEEAPAASALFGADAWLTGFEGKLPYAVHASTDAGREATEIAGLLELYNSGDLTPNCAGEGTCPNCPPDGSVSPDGPDDTADGTGAPCKSAASCATGYCVDGVCCESACEGDCRTCRLPGLHGICGLLERGMQARECGVYACDGLGACLTACATRDDCLPTLFCDENGECVPRRPEGAPCNSHNDCLRGFCMSGTAGSVCDASKGRLASGKIAFCAAAPRATSGWPGAALLVILALILAARRLAMRCGPGTSSPGPNERNCS